MSHIGEYVEHVTKAARYLKTLIPDSPHGAVQTGTEPGGLLNYLSQKQVIDYSDISFFPAFTIEPQLEWFVVEIIHEFPPQV